MCNAFYGLCHICTSCTIFIINNNNNMQIIFSCIESACFQQVYCPEFSIDFLIIENKGSVSIL